MICRKLVKDKQTKKQNIVWFGSYGRNLDYIPFTEQPINWGQNYQTYYIFVSETQNTSGVWEENKFYEKKDDGRYVLLVDKPGDWDNTYQNYYEVEFTPNTNYIFDPNETYYLHYNKLQNVF